jgi:hypothetical protein
MFLIVLTKNVAEIFFIKQFNKKCFAIFLIILIENIMKCFFNNLIKNRFLQNVFNYFNKKCCENIFY